MSGGTYLLIFNILGASPPAEDAPNPYRPGRTATADGRFGRTRTADSRMGRSQSAETRYLKPKDPV